MKECCQDEANLSEPHTLNPDKPELTVRTCKCGANHYELDADALELGVFGAEV